MRGRAVWSGLVAMTVAVGFLLAGCATSPGGAPGASASQADLLQQAGFKVYTANTPSKLTYLNALPAGQVVANQYQGQSHYLVCTNPGTRQCYVGDEAAYQRYQQLALQAAISQDQSRVSNQRFDPEALQMWAESQGGGR
jgi:hypothetical protein